MAVLSPPQDRSETHCNACDEHIAMCCCPPTLQAIAENERKAFVESLPEDDFSSPQIPTHAPPSPDAVIADAGIARLTAVIRSSDFSASIAEEDDFAGIPPAESPPPAPIDDGHFVEIPKEKKKRAPKKTAAPAPSPPEVKKVPLAFSASPDAPAHYSYAPAQVSSLHALTLDKDGLIAGFKRPEDYKNEYVSVSRLKTYETCPRQFFFHYVVKAPALPEEPNAPSVLGNVLHEALESVFRWVRDEEYSGLVKSDIYFRFLDEAWASFEMKENGKRARGQLDGLDLYLYARKAIVEYFAGRHVSWHTTVGIEEEFNANFPGGTKVKGFIDRIERDGDTAVIIDYKNGFMLFTEDELKNDLQMSVYDLVVRKMYPWVKKTRFEFHMLRYGGQVQTTERTDEHREAVKRYLPMVARMSETDPTYEPRRNKYCSYCSYRNLCHVYQQTVNQNDERSSIDESVASDVAIQFERTNTIAKNAKNRAERLKKLLLSHMVAKGVEAIEAGGYVFRRVGSTQQLLPGVRTYELLKESGCFTEAQLQKLVRIGKEAVEELLKELLFPYSEDRAKKKTMLEVEILAGVEKVEREPYIQVAKGSLDGVKR